MVDVLRDPVWQGIGVILAVLMGLISIYYSEKKRVWILIIAGALVTLIVGFAFGVQYAINRPDKPAESTYLQLEKIPQELKAFSGSDGTVPGNASVRIAYETEYTPRYILYYDIPEASLGFAGIAFEFNKTVSVVEYKFVEFTVEFSHPGDSVEIYLADLGGNKAAVRISDNGNGKVEASVPLENFGDIDLNALSEINFFTRNETQSGGYDIVISNIRFSK